MLYFLVYNDHNQNCYLDYLLQSVRVYGKEFNIIVFDKDDIDNDFIKNKSILNCSIGGGYWLWKPYIINETLKKINDNDIIFYLDSKYYFIEHFRNLYVEYMKNNDLLVWKNKPNEIIWYMKNWCKMDVICKYNMFNKVFNENAEECWAGGFIIKKTENTKKYIQEWLDMCCIYENITDSKSKIENSNLFNEHKHDQSLLGIILHKYNIQMKFLEKKYIQNVRIPFLYKIKSNSIHIGNSETNTKVIKLDKIYPPDTELTFIHDWTDTFNYKFNKDELNIQGQMNHMGGDRIYMLI